MSINFVDILEVIRNHISLTRDEMKANKSNPQVLGSLALVDIKLNDIEQELIKLAESKRL